MRALEFMRGTGCCRGLESSLVNPVVTPRFVPSCSLPLLQGLGRLAREHGCHVQSHISESLDNDAFVHALHPEVRHVHAHAGAERTYPHAVSVRTILLFSCMSL